MDRRFVSLRICGAICKIAAWICLILGSLASFVVLIAGLASDSLLDWAGLAQNGTLLAVLAFLLLLVVSTLLFLGLYALGELLLLALAIEENTRRAAYLAQQQFLAAQGERPGMPLAIKEADASGDTEPGTAVGD